MDDFLEESLEARIGGLEWSRERERSDKDFSDSGEEGDSLSDFSDKICANVGFPSISGEESDFHKNLSCKRRELSSLSGEAEDGKKVGDKDVFMT